MPLGGTFLESICWINSSLSVPRGYNIGYSEYRCPATDELTVQSVSIEQFRQLCAKVTA